MMMYFIAGFIIGGMCGMIIMGVLAAEQIEDSVKAHSRRKEPFTGDLGMKHLAKRINKQMKGEA